MPITAIIVAGVGFQAAGGTWESGCVERRRGSRAPPARRELLLI